MIKPIDTAWHDCELLSKTAGSSDLMHHSFVVPAPMGPENNGAFNFSVFKALLNALHFGDKFMVKSLLKATPRRLTIRGQSLFIKAGVGVS